MMRVDGNALHGSLFEFLGIFIFYFLLFSLGKGKKAPPFFVHTLEFGSGKEV